MSTTLPTSSDPPPRPDPQLNALIVSAFEYIAQTAVGSDEDRARVSNYYLVTAGTAVAAIVGSKLDPSAPKEISLGFSVVFGALFFLGLFTLLSLIRLRAGWMSSASAMNQIVKYYRDAYQSDKVQLEQVLPWMLGKLPAAGKPNSVAFWIAMSAILVDSMMAAGAILFYYLGQGLKALERPLLDNAVWGFAIAVGGQLLIYFWSLHPWRDPET